MASLPDLENKLAQRIRSNRLHPSIVFQGPVGVSSALVQRLSKILFCTAGGLTACEKCSGCKQVEKKIHPDLLWFENPEEEGIKAEAVRAWIHQMELSPIAGGARLAILPHAHRMTMTSANALLKALEEPLPDRFYWLLTSQTAGLPITLRSRCLWFRIGDENQAIPSAAMRELDRLLQDVFATGAVKPLLDACEDKQDAAIVFSILQEKVRNWTVGEAADIYGWKPASPFEAASFFGEIVELEGLLRGNSNVGLAVENFFLQHRLGGRHVV